jgi:hypothetical protein
MQKKIAVALGLLMGLILSTQAFAGGTEADTAAGNKPAAESGGSGR